MQEENIKAGTLRVMKAAFMAGSSFAKVHQKHLGRFQIKLKQKQGGTCFLMIH